MIGWLEYTYMVAAYTTYTKMYTTAGKYKLWFAELCDTVF